MRFRSEPSSELLWKPLALAFHFGHRSRRINIAIHPRANKVGCDLEADRVGCNVTDSGIVIIGREYNPVPMATMVARAFVLRVKWRVV